MIKLTDWETGEPVYVDPAAIKSMRQLTSEQSEIGDTIHELGRRTRVDTDTDCFLVREDADEIFAMIKADSPEMKTHE